MKKITVFICAAALACSMSFPAFAAQTKKEYNTETAQVRQELADTSASIKNLQKSNRTASDAAKTVRQGWKDSGQLKEHKDTWNQVRELKDDITEVQVSYTEASGQARLLKAQAKNDVKDGKYDEAIAKLNQCLEQKKKALSSMEQINGIWVQIQPAGLIPCSFLYLFPCSCLQDSSVFCQHGFHLGAPVLHGKNGAVIVKRLRHVLSSCSMN